MLKTKSLCSILGINAEDMLSDILSGAVTVVEPLSELWWSIVDIPDRAEFLSYYDDTEKLPTVIVYNHVIDRRSDCELVGNYYRNVPYANSGEYEVVCAYPASGLWRGTT
jgi:hypothetical protein